MITTTEVDPRPAYILGYSVMRNYWFIEERASGKQWRYSTRERAIVALNRRLGAAR